MGGMIRYVPVRRDQGSQALDHCVAVLRKLVKLVAGTISRDQGGQVTGSNFTKRPVYRADPVFQPSGRVVADHRNRHHQQDSSDQERGSDSAEQGRLRRGISADEQFQIGV